MTNETPPPTVAVILTHNRPELLTRAVAAAASQVAGLIVLDNASDPPVQGHDIDAAAFGSEAGSWPEAVIVRHDSHQPANLSRLWNLGRELATRALVRITWGRSAFDGIWNLVLLCDDAVLPDGWVHTVAGGMRAHNAAAASTHQATPVRDPILKLEPDSDLWNRMCPWAFMLAGEKALRADERLAWWWCDTHMDWQARKNGGMVILPGPVVANGVPNGWLTTKTELAEQAGRDGETFVSIWGWRPW